MRAIFPKEVKYGGHDGGNHFLRFEKEIKKVLRQKTVREAYALRVFPAETRLTVYRRLLVKNLEIGLGILKIV